MQSSPSGIIAVAAPFLFVLKGPVNPEYRHRKVTKMAVTCILGTLHQCAKLFLGFIFYGRM